MRRRDFCKLAASAALASPLSRVLGRSPAPDSANAEGAKPGQPCRRKKATPPPACKKCGFARAGPGW